MRAEELSMHTITTIAWPQLVHICVLVLKNLSVPVMYLLDPPKYIKRTIPFAGTGASQLKTGNSVVQSEATQATWKAIDKA